MLTYRVGVPGGPLGLYWLLPLIIHISVTVAVGCSGEQYGVAPQPSRLSGTYNLLWFLGNGAQRSGHGVGWLLALGELIAGAWLGRAGGVKWRAAF